MNNPAVQRSCKGSSFTQTVLHDHDTVNITRNYWLSCGALTDAWLYWGDASRLYSLFRRWSTSKSHQDWKHSQRDETKAEIKFHTESWRKTLLVCRSRVHFNQTPPREDWENKWPRTYFSMKIYIPGFQQIWTKYRFCSYKLPFSQVICDVFTYLVTK